MKYVIDLLEKDLKKKERIIAHYKDVDRDFAKGLYKYASEAIQQLQEAIKKLK